MIRIYENPPRHQWSELQQRNSSDDDRISERVGEIIGRVREEGDRALFELARQIDGVELATLRVSEQEIAEAASAVPDEVRQAIGKAIGNIRRFHEAQRPAPVDIETTEGVRCCQRAVPIRRVGLYIPGGNAPLFSTVLMLAVPASVAGCSEVVLCSPPNKQGGIAPVILYAASQCGVREIYKCGGAQAIAALAYGTETIARCDKIFGPGNRYVTQAKQAVGGHVCAIDMPAGPSEVMVIADDESNPQFVAADLLSQAEHGNDSQSILLCLSADFARRVDTATEEQYARLSRRQTISNSLNGSRIIVLEDLAQAVDFANGYAPEHLIIQTRRPWEIAERITAAGSVFVGDYSTESAGDYASGTNHTLPTSGWARSMSGVNLDSFMHKITFQELSREGLEALAPTITAMAEAEGLDAHAEAVRIRLKQQKS
mgnify:CR=1 FL=1